MSDRRKTASERTPAERLASIEERQQRLLAELDRLDGLVEAALGQFGAAVGVETLAPEG